jgi:hypothetical protein
MTNTRAPKLAIEAQSATLQDTVSQKLLPKSVKDHRHD